MSGIRKKWNNIYCLGARTPCLGARLKGVQLKGGKPPVSHVHGMWEAGARKRVQLISCSSSYLLNVECCYTETCFAKLGIKKKI